MLHTLFTKGVQHLFCQRVPMASVCLFDIEFFHSICLEPITEFCFRLLLYFRRDVTSHGVYGIQQCRHIIRES